MQICSLPLLAHHISQSGSDQARQQKHCWPPPYSQGLVIAVSTKPCAMLGIVVLHPSLVKGHHICSATAGSPHDHGRGARTTLQRGARSVSPGTYLHAWELLLCSVGGDAIVFLIHKIVAFFF